jgi:hypothetical protein
MRKAVVALLLFLVPSANATEKWVETWQSDKLTYEVDAGSYQRIGPFHVHTARITYTELQKTLVGDEPLIRRSVDTIAVYCSSDKRGEPWSVIDSTTIYISEATYRDDGEVLWRTPAERTKELSAALAKMKPPVKILDKVMVKGPVYIRYPIPGTVGELHWKSSCRDREQIKAQAREQGAGDAPYNCSKSAQFYQDEYRRTQNVSALVCMQRALERELK